ncbi:hypothetical protein GCM10029964_053160 [Kibdelosporangium lantanae]
MPHVPAGSSTRSNRQSHANGVSTSGTPRSASSSASVSDTQSSPMLSTLDIWLPHGADTAPNSDCGIGQLLTQGGWYGMSSAYWAIRSRSRQTFAIARA